MIFLVFCGIFLMMNWVTVNIYLFVWDAMMLAAACGDVSGTGPYRRDQWRMGNWKDISDGRVLQKTWGRI